MEKYFLYHILDYEYFDRFIGNYEKFNDIDVIEMIKKDDNLYKLFWEKFQILPMDNDLNRSIRNLFKREL